MSKKFSLLMPTRNRAEYLASGVGYFLGTAREDVELIVCDCSDAHHACVQALAPWKHDPRLIVIDNSVAATGKLSSMAENWSRALDAAQGRWVTIIGDDDVCDPAVVEFIDRLEAVSPGIAAVSWHRAHFDIGIDVPREAKIPLGHQIMLAAGRDSLLKQAQWPNPKQPPTSLCSPYHGAVRRDVLESLKAQRGGWFRFSIPDYDLGWSVAWAVDRFALCERPFSITGTSPKSNSYSVRNEGKRAEYLANWMRESRVLDGWGETADAFLFTLPMTVLGFRNAFCAALGISVEVNRENLVGALKNSLANQEDEDSFEMHRAALLKYLVMNFQQDFGVAAMQRFVRPAEAMAGVVGDKLVAPNTLFGGDITRFAEIAFGVVRPVSYLFAGGK